jgi:hypothetical protein
VARRFLISLAVAAAGLGAASAPVSAASAPSPYTFQHAPVVSHPGDYWFEAESCYPTSPTSTTCAGEYLYSNAPGAASIPMGGYFYCLTETQTQLEAIEVDFGTESPATPPHMVGVGGVLPGVPSTGLYSNVFVGTAYPWYAYFFESPTSSPIGQPTAGSAIGVVRADNSTGQITSGVINISVHGGAFLESEQRFGPGQASGSMSCQIKPGPDSYANWSGSTSGGGGDLGPH